MMRTKNLILATAILIVTSGCMKRTVVQHCWPDGSVSRVSDWRLNMRQEAYFRFEVGTNGVKSIEAGVSSGADPTAVATGQKLAEMGIELMKAAK